MKIQPLKDNVVIAPEKREEKNKTETGIYLPETAENDNEKPQIGKVIAIGDSEKIAVAEGDKVIYNKYSGTEVSVDNNDYLIVKNDDILAIIK